MARILVVDDDPDFVEIIRLVLTSEGHEVITASDGEAAVRLVQERHPDLVVLDVMMASMLDGVDAAHRIGAAADGARTPIIMVSSITSSPLAGMFPTDEHLPIDAWISKPVSPKELLKQVSRLVGG
jgi:DNA-binding response OmpR family regulator